MTDTLPESASGPERGLKKTIVLVGLMGAGKSTIGRRLAAVIGAPFWDSDDEIVAAAGMTIPEIFDLYGEDHFRDRERRVIERLLSGEHGILATGGGAFMDEASRKLMLEMGHVVWLRADLDTLTARCGRREDRPLLRTGDPREILADLMARRYPVYGQAHSIVDSIDAPHEAVMEDVLATLKSAGALD